VSPWRRGGLDLSAQGRNVFGGAPLSLLGLEDAAWISRGQTFGAALGCVGRIAQLTGKFRAKDARPFIVAGCLFARRNGSRRRGCLCRHDIHQRGQQ
jgi:hypothetical protein